jgi:cytochrome c biogenesis protein CcdA
MMNNLMKYIPRVTKRGLLFVAGLAWMLTSGFLIFSGISNILSDNSALILRIGIALPIGILFYVVIFRRVIYKYLDRIFSMRNKKHFILSFMGLKGYTFMLVMTSIILSIELYKVIALDYVFTFQTIMSIPVFLCSLMFFKAWKQYE